MLIDAIPSPALLLDTMRRAVMGNALLRETFHLSGEEFIGSRPGELLGCLFSKESPQGCGSGAHCTVCGALRAILLCHDEGGQSVQECQIVLGGAEEGALDLEVTATSAVLDGEPYILVVFKDVSSEKRRSVLERLFFHDLLNTVGGIHGLAQLLSSETPSLPERDQECRQWLRKLSEQLIDEIIHQRKLLSAERGDFTPEIGIVETGNLLREVQALYSGHDICIGKSLVLGDVCSSSILSDRQILRRILGNLVKNALEASERGSTVTISCTENDHDITFLVNNPGIMPREVQLQLFRRSFSTKGEVGRGIGTYSVKLFGERYLKGKVAFESSERDGTTFSFSLPKISG
jgi:signal transduction histidine kinase